MVGEMEKKLWLNLRYYSSICLEELKRTITSGRRAERITKI
jgi:hypothetical protein